MTIEKQNDGTFGFQPSDETFYQRKSFDSFVRALGAFTDARQRMLQNENAYFGFVAGPNIPALERAGAALSRVDIDGLYARTQGKQIADTGCYFLEESVDGGIIVAKAKIGDLLGFISLRNPTKDRAKYSLGVTSTVNGTPVFTTYGGGPIIITGTTTADLIPGRLHLDCTGTDLQSLRVNADKNETDVRLRLTGRRRYSPSVAIGTRGISNDQTYHSEQVAKSVQFVESIDPKYFYDLDARLIGVN